MLTALEKATVLTILQFVQNGHTSFLPLSNYKKQKRMDLKSDNSDTGLYEDRRPATSSQVPAEPIAGAYAFSSAFIRFL